MRKRFFVVASATFAFFAIIALVVAGSAAVRAALLVDSIPGADDGRGITPQLHHLQAAVPTAFLLAIFSMGIAVTFVGLAFRRKSESSSITGK